MKIDQLETANTIQGHITEIVDAMGRAGGQPAGEENSRAIPILLKVVDNEPLLEEIHAKLKEAAKLRLQNLQVQFENL